MLDNERAYAIAASGAHSVEVIDGGDTLAVRLCASDGSETCLLLPIGVVGDLLFQVADALNVGVDQTSRPLG